MPNSRDGEKKTGTGRVWQLDALRGVAMILMTVFHALVDIRDFFGFADIRYFEPPWMYIGRTSAVLFMLVSGMSCRFSKGNIRRGGRVLLIGMGVTAVTYFAVPDLYIRFGILHFLGSAMILTGLADKIPDARVKRAVVWAAVPAALLLGQYAGAVRTELPFLFPIGIITDSFRTYDYYPLLPWLGVFLAGFAAGEFIHKNQQRFAAFRIGRVTAALAALGRFSLPYYILHQPALILIFRLCDLLFAVAFHL